MRLLPRSLEWQAVLVLVGALLLSHLASVTAYYFDRKQTLADAEVEDLAEQIIRNAATAAPLASPERHRILAAARSRYLTVGTDAPFDIGPCDPATLPESVQRIAENRLPPGVEWRACVEEPLGLFSLLADIFSRVEREDAILTMAIRFPDGEVAQFRGVVPETPSFFTDRTITYVLLAALLVGVVADRVIRRVTLPLRRFGRQATEIGKNLNAPPLEERGPSEVVNASRAFNRMHTRLKRLIGNRTEMLAGISHDLRTPITRMKLRVEMMEEGEAREKLLRELDEMETMVAAVLEFVRGAMPTEQQRVVDLNALVESLCSDLAESGAPVRYVTPWRPVRLACRPTALRRALQNVVMNAVTHAGSAVVEVHDQDEAVEIRVLDRGPGIPEDQLEAVLQPFYRVESSRNRGTGGHGLGLAITATAAHAHGGMLVLANRPGGGLMACLHLPR